MKTKIYEKTLPLFPLYPSTIDTNYNQTKIVREEGYPLDEIFIVKSGSGILNIEGKTYTLEENDMFYLHANVPHEYFRTGETFVTSYLSYFGNEAEAIRNYYSLSDFGIYKGKNHGSFEAHLNDLFKNFDRLHELSTLSAITYRSVIAFFDEACKKEYTPIEKVYNYLEANYSNQITLDDILSVYPYSKTKLSLDFKKAYGKTVFEVLTEIRIRHAQKMLLHNPHISLKNIAASSGYSDVSYFCKMYRKILGTSPKSGLPYLSAEEQ